MAGEPVKHLALGLVRCEVADQGAFGCVFSELFDLLSAFGFPNFDPQEQAESI